MSRWVMDDQFLGHHKTKRAMRAGLEALQLWLAIRTYVAVNLSDGFLPDEDVDDLPHAPKNPRKWLAVLVSCGAPKQDGGRGPGLVDQVPGGWRLHDFEHHGELKTTVEARREQTRERVRKHRELSAKRHQKPAESEPRNAVTNGTGNSVSNGVSNGPLSYPNLTNKKISDTAIQGPDRLETHVRPTAAAAGEKPPKQIPDVAVRCPQDLGLLPEQRGALEMSAGIPAWAIDQLRNDFVFAEMGRLNKRMTVERWRVCLSKAITSRWSDPSRRPKKPEPEYDPRKANEPSPAQRAFERRIEEERRAKHAAIHAERLAAGKVTGTDMAEVIAIATGGARG